MVFKKGYTPWSKGKHLTEEHRNKIGLTKIGNKYCLGRHLTEEQKQKISKSEKGKIVSTEARINIGNASRGRIHSEETRLKMSNSNKGKHIEHIWWLGRHHSEETKIKLREQKIGSKNPNFGKHVIHSEETRRKISQAKIGKHRDLTFFRVYLINRPTKPQLKLFEKIKFQYPDKEVVMEYLIRTKAGHRFIDVAVPDLKLGFEYDGPYWHQDKEKDQYRHELIEAEGWQLTHYSDVSELRGLNV